MENKIDNFSKELFWGTETKLGRAFVQDRVLDDENSINILGSILKLSPIQKAMASKQMKSVYLAKLLENT